MSDKMKIWKKKRRMNYLEKREYQYYIFCEGQQTEPLYFEGFKKCIENNPIYREMVLIEIEPCQAETMRVIGKAERYLTLPWPLGRGFLLPATICIMADQFISARS